MLELYAHPFSSYSWKVLIPLATFNLLVRIVVPKGERVLALGTFEGDAGDFWKGSHRRESFGRD